MSASKMLLPRLIQDHDLLVRSVPDVDKVYTCSLQHATTLQVNMNVFSKTHHLNKCRIMYGESQMMFADQSRISFVFRSPDLGGFQAHY